MLIIKNKGRFKKGQKPWNKGLKGKIIPWNKGKKGVQVAWNIGKFWPEKTKQKMSLSKKGKHYSLKTEFKKGFKPWNWGIVGVGTYRKFYLQHLSGLFCEDCGKNLVESQKRFHVHHKDKNRYNNSIENLRLLCVSCHRKYHPRTKK